MSSLPLKVSERTKDGTAFFEGTVTIPGVKPTKLIKKSDQTTQFGTKASLLSTARSFAKRLGFEGLDRGEPVAKAAKKSIRTATPAKAKTKAARKRTKK